MIYWFCLSLRFDLISEKLFSIGCFEVWRVNKYEFFIHPQEFFSCFSINTFGNEALACIFLWLSSLPHSCMDFIFSSGDKLFKDLLSPWNLLFHLHLFSARKLYEFYAHTHWTLKLDNRLWTIEGSTVSLTA